MVFFSFFSSHPPYTTVWHIFPTGNSCMASSCLRPSLILSQTITHPVYNRHSSCLQLILSPLFIWPSFITRRYLSCRHPHPDDYLFVDVCPRQHESPACQYGLGLRQWAVNQAIIHGGRHRVCIVLQQWFLPHLSHRYWMGSSSSANDVLIQYRWAPHSVSFALQSYIPDILAFRFAGIIVPHQVSSGADRIIFCRTCAEE